MNRIMAIVLGAGVLLAGGAAWGSPIGPDSNGYYAGLVTYNWVEVAAPGASQGTPILAGTGDATTGIPIGFAFTFYGAAYSTAYVSSNGLVTFGAGDPTYANLDWSAFYPTYPSIAPLWDDWDAADAAAWYKTDGAPGSRRLIVQWEAFKHWPLPDGASEPVTFQMVLSEGSNDILFQYKDADASNSVYSGGASATIGIAEGPLQDGYLQWSYNSASVASGDALLFSKDPAHIPDPATLLLLAAGAGLAAIRRRRRRVRS